MKLELVNNVMIISQKPDFNLAQLDLCSLYPYLYILTHFNHIIDTVIETPLLDYYKAMNLLRDTIRENAQRIEAF